MTALPAESPSVTSGLRVSVQLAKPASFIKFLCEQLPNVYVFSAHKMFATFRVSFPDRISHLTISQYRCDGVVVRASASQSVDLGFISQVESYQKTLKNGIHSFPVWRSANRDSVENKPASLLVVSLRKTLNVTPPSLCGRQMVGPSSLPVVVAPV